MEKENQEPESPEAAGQLSVLETARLHKRLREEARLEPSHLDPIAEENYNPSIDEIEGAAGFDIRQLWHPRSHWSPAKKIEVVTTYLYSGNFVKTSRITGVPRETIMHWRKHACWWTDTEEKCRAIIDDEMEAGYRKILKIGVEELADKLVDGEEVVVATRKRVQPVIDPKTGKQAFYMDRNGKKEYQTEEIVTKDWENKPILSKDMNRIVGTMQEKILLLQGRPTSIKASAGSNTDVALQKIGAKLAELGEATKPMKVINEQDGKGNINED